MKIYQPKHFPDSDLEAEGMKFIQGDPLNIEPAIQELEPVYAIKDGMQLHIRFVFPMSEGQPGKKYPLLVYVQGSGWREQFLDNNMMDLYEIVKGGVAVAVIQHRPTYLCGFPAQVADVKTAVRYLEKHAAVYPVDMENLFLGGDSSGGHIVLCCVATWDTHELDESWSELPKLRGVLDFYGPADLSRYSGEATILDRSFPSSPEGRLMGGFDLESNPELAYRCSPVAYFCEGQVIPPLLIMHGSRDMIVPFSQSVILYERLKELHIQGVEFYKILGANHGGSAFWCEETKNVVKAFIHKNIQ